MYLYLNILCLFLRELSLVKADSFQQAIATDKPQILLTSLQVHTDGGRPGGPPPPPEKKIMATSPPAYGLKICEEKDPLIEINNVPIL